MNLNNNIDTIVELVFSMHDQGVTDDSLIIEKLKSEFSLSTNDAETVLELIQTGLFRASFIAGGQTYPKNNLFDNTIVNAAIKIVLKKLGHTELYKSTVAVKRPWWKLW